MSQLETQTITRRSALTAIATIPDSGMASIASAQAEVHDPMLAAINDYREGMARFMAIPESDLITGGIENEFALAEATYGSAANRILMNEPHRPKITTIAGVREAIRLTLDEQAIICDMSLNALRAALAYLDAAAPIDESRGST